MKKRQPHDEENRRDLLSNPARATDCSAGPGPQSKRYLRRGGNHTGDGANAFTYDSSRAQLSDNGNVVNQSRSTASATREQERSGRYGRCDNHCL